MKALVGAFNQEKALVGAFSVIVKTDCETDGSFYSTKQEAVVHVNTNTLLLEPGEEEDNDTMSRPQLSVTVDYETPEDTGVEAAEDEDKYLSLDSYNVHSPQFHPQVDLELAYKIWIVFTSFCVNEYVDNNLLLHHFSGTLLVLNTVELTFRRHLYPISTRI